LRLIPVLDLMGGVPVRARAGQRQAYRPLESRLSHFNDAVHIVEGLLNLHPFTTLYVADLDAILGQGNHDGVLENLARHFPQLAFWVDGGFPSLDAAGQWRAKGLGQPVLGSETMLALPEATAYPAGAVLSLDFRDASGEQTFLGPQGLVEALERWPADVILMTLGRVGLSQGPDLETLARFRHRAPNTRFYAAGGVRDQGDLERLAQAGATGVLLASALHDGRFSPGSLAAFHPAPQPSP